MFESKLKNISRDIFNNKYKKKYFILTNEKNKREMYFICGNKEALKFAKPKFNSIKKRIIYFLLIMGILHPFLKKIELSREIGDVIFVGGQIKGFNLKDKLANSFLHHQGARKEFIKGKKDQKTLSEKGFAPRIIELNEGKCFSQEELFSTYIGVLKPIFNKLFEFYNIEGYTKNTKLYNELRLFLEKNYADEPLLKKALMQIRRMDYFLFTEIHGEFSKAQCLIDCDKILFVDWSLRKGLLTEDLVNCFRMEDYSNRKNFKKIARMYPAHVRENLKEYLLATELLRLTQKGNIELSKLRIHKLMK